MKYYPLLVLILFLVMPSSSLATYDYNSKEFKAVIDQLDMQGHANDDLATCKVKQMYYDEVTEMLNDGMSGEEILKSYVDEYGQAALREPASDKSGLAAWGMPVVGIVAGISIVTIWLRKLKGKNKQENQHPSLQWDSELDKEITEKIFDEERRKHF